MFTLTKKAVKNKLLEVMDPELNISIVDLGLIYGIKINANNKVVITMTLTTIGCPLFSLIEDEIRIKLKELGVKDLKINLIFDPPWSMDKMTAKGKVILGI
ncbi:DNA methyltransferase [Candidatus Roizmanbacteria bacterium CG_4_9_14_0_8_um_filter_34_12]|uniref:DNA methyltransferase n=2 Tax=Candidatus Roizmaniibacteriota TaxID=1752723 RepID=A0A2M8DE19_9BACT|nr:metal-sulfur cluster assembly factor [Candidatus Roizmanbacteria bacterium]PJB89544.1 MAG: DNA methyltransferase [Candidatus Roizmanbacteria bacterium CG_4_9_14_0_8_um_filter_34_12]